MTDCEKCCENTIDCKCYRKGYVKINDKLYVNKETLMIWNDCNAGHLSYIEMLEMYNKYLKKEEKMNWIKLADQKPNKSGPYKIAFLNQSLVTQYVGRWDGLGFNHHNVIWWAEMDEPPIEDNIDNDFKKLSNAHHKWEAISADLYETKEFINVIYAFLEKKFKETK